MSVVHEPSDDSIMTETPDIVQLVEQFIEEVKQKCLEPLFYPLNFNIPVSFDEYERVTPFLDIVMIPRIYRKRKYLTKRKLLS